MSDPILQFSTALRGEPQGVLRISSIDDLVEAESLLDALLSGEILGKMNNTKDLLKDKPDAIALVQTELGGQVIQEYSAPPPQAQPSYAAQPVPSQCSLGTKGSHAMACKTCAGPIGQRKAMGNYQGHECLSHPKSDQNPNGCKPTWCN